MSIRFLVLGAALLALIAQSASAAGNNYASSKSNTAGIAATILDDCRKAGGTMVEKDGKQVCVNSAGAAIATSLSNLKSPPQAIKQTQAPAGH